MNQNLKDLAERYLSVLNQKTFDGSAADDLFDQGVSYSSPTANGQGAEQVLSELQGFHRHFDTLTRKRVFMEEGELCMLYEASSSHAELGSFEVAEWLSIEGSRISSVRRIYDARSLERLRAEI